MPKAGPAGMNNITIDRSNRIRFPDHYYGLIVIPAFGASPNISGA